jgi:hypothetical protein
MTSADLKGTVPSGKIEKKRSPTDMLSRFQNFVGDLMTTLIQTGGR